MQIITTNNNSEVLPEPIIKTIKRAEMRLKIAKMEVEECHLAIKEFMEKNDVKKIDNEDLTITYIEETDAEQFNRKAFKSENPGLYEKYAYFSPRAASIRVKVKENGTLDD